MVDTGEAARLGAMTSEQAKNQNGLRRRGVRKPGRRRGTECWGTGVQRGRRSWEWLCHSQHSQGLQEGRSQLEAVEFHFIVNSELCGDIMGWSV